MTAALAHFPTQSVNSAQRAESLGAEITELYAWISAATYELLVKIREFDRDELWAGMGLCSCAHWLNWQCGIGMNAGREKVRVARALEDLPQVSEAFRQGQLSYSKVRAITRIANADNEESLLMIARHGTAHHLESVVRGYRRANRLNAESQAVQQHESRAFHYLWDDDGSLVFNGRLPAEVGAMLLQALQGAMDREDSDRDDRDSDRSGDRDNDETRDDNATSDNAVEQAPRQPLSQRRADAIAELAESYLSTGPASSCDRYQVMLHVTAETPARGAHARIENGPDVSAETSRRICCDSSISKLVEDERGEPLSIGRKSRVIPPPMRRALKARDGNCRFPGCTHRHFIDGHHIRHWADGGETRLDNLVQLCRRHHRLVHEGGFRCEQNANGQIEFRTPAGALIRNTGAGSVIFDSRYRGNVTESLQRKLEDRHIDAQTIVTEWGGEIMDLHLAVELLCGMD